MNNTTIEQLAYLIKYAKDNHKPKPIVFLGAGASKTGGIPLAGEIVQDILEKYKENPSIRDTKDEEKTYAKLMELLSPDERNTLLKEYIGKGKINVTHIYLAQLIKEGYVDYVLTVNFDNLMLRALALYNEFPPVYDMAVLKDLTTTAFKEKSVVYLHGQHHGLWLLNTEEEMGKVESTLLRIIDPIKNGRAWIFIGYSGEDPVFNHITNLGRFDNGLFWVAYNNNLPGEKVCKELLERTNTNARIIQGYDADSFMLKLSIELGIEQPLIIDKPFTSLGDMLDNIVDIDDKEHFKEVKKRLVIAKTNVNVAKEQFERGVVENNVALKEEIDTNLLKKQIIDIILRDKFDDESAIAAIEQQVAKSSNPEILELFSALYGNWGNTLYDLAQLKNEEGLYRQSIEKYMNAISLKPDDSITYNNWGNALSELAKLKNEEGLYRQSIEKYEKSMSLKPDDSDTYNNWGAALSDLARLKNEEGLYLESFEKYKKAVSLKPNHSDAYNSWGNALSELAKLKNEEGLYRESFEKYMKAVSLKPDDSDIYNNWGAALADFAKLKNEESLYLQSIEKYERAVSLKPDDSDVYNNWGAALYDLAQLKNEEGLYRQSIEKYKKAARLKPDDSDTYNNWGNALSYLAELKNEEGLYRQSFEKYMKAVSLKPDDSDIYNNWGGALADFAKLRNEESLYRESFEKYEKAVSLKPDDSSAYYDWGSALFELAKLKNEESLFTVSLEKLKRGFDLGGEGYNLACWYAVRNAKEDAIKYLDIALAKKQITVPFVETDSDWDGLKGDPDFIALLDKYR